MIRFSLFLLLSLASVASADQPENSKFLYTRQGCDPFVEVMGVMSGKYGEEPLFVGEGLQFGTRGQPYTGGAMFLVNQSTGTWSLIHLYADGTACVTAVGTGFTPYTGE